MATEHMLKVVVAGALPSSLLNFRGPLLRTLVSRGHTVIASAAAETASPDVVEGLTQLGVRFIAVPITRAGMKISGDIKTLLAYRQLLMHEKPDVLLAYTAKPVIYAGLACRGRDGIRFFPMITGLGYAFTEGQGLKRALLRGIVRRLYGASLGAAQTVIFQNPDDQSMFHELGLGAGGVGSACVFGSGVDLEAFPPAPLPNEPVFLMLARLVADKGVREYVQAARQVKARYPQARFVLAGGLDPNPAGIKAAELDEWIAEGCIEYVGSVSPVQPLLADCRFYVLPSYREGVPRSILEAMATGRPVITTDAPGCRETVDHGVNGLLVPLRDADALAGAMIDLLERPDVEIRTMARASLQMAREKFDVHKVNQQLLHIMEL